MKPEIDIRNSQPVVIKWPHELPVSHQNLEFGNGFVRWLLRFFSGKHIFVKNQLYLTRYYLVGDGSGKGIELYLHILHDVDRYRWTHNHPWRWFMSIVLHNTYKQDVLNTETGRRYSQHIRKFSRISGQSTYHAIRELPDGPVWTLFLASQKTGRRWGYWDEERAWHVPDEDIEANNSTTIRFGRKKIVD